MKIKETKGTLFGEKCTVIMIDPGNVVVCDLCNQDYTNDNESKGGMLFCGKAVCPECFDEFMIGIKKYHEEKYIKAIAMPDETFRDFVYRVRKES